ncbi:MAG: hypothetical protein Q7J80_15590, partial [Anaerolineales bacterium]|nr:hypothetical protein [Anaerolineales bacterium]
METFGSNTGFRGFHHVHIGLIQRGHVDVSRIAVLDFQITHTAAHVPDDVILLPVLAQRFCEFVVGLI